MSETKKRIIIVGAGAVGGYVGGYMARAGHNVTLFDPWPAHVEAMQSQGLTLAGLTEPECFTVPVRAMHLTDVQALVREGAIDIAFICMKSYDTEWSTMLVRDYLAPGGYVVSLQNCLNEERVAHIVGWGKTLGCIASRIAVELHAPAQIRRSVPLGGDKHTVFRVGEVHGRITDRANEIAALLAPIDSVKVTENLWGERWSKLVLNAMRNGVSAATGYDSNECDRDPVTRDLIIRIGGEAVRIGQALGYVLETIGGFAPEMWAKAERGDKAAYAEINSRLQKAGETGTRTPGARPSMGQDVLKGRRTEIEFINGFIAAKGKEVGLDAPANTGLVTAVKRVEAGETPPRPDNVAGI